MGVAIALSAVVHKYGEVLSARSEFRSPSFDPSRRPFGPPQDERDLHFETVPSHASILRDGATSRASSGRAEFGCSGILRASGILLWHMLRTTASLRQTGIRRSEGTEPQQEGV